MRIREVIVKAPDIAHIGTTPPIDRLIVVTDHKQIATAARELLDDFVLRTIGVLLFVDQKIVIAGMKTRNRRTMQKCNSAEQQVVEIDGIGLLEQGIIARITMRNDALFG